MRAAILLLLAGCASVKPALTAREEEPAPGITPEETTAWEAAWEEREAARAVEHVAMAPAPPPAMARPAPTPVADLNRLHAEAPAPRPVPAEATVATVILHTPAGDMEVKCPNVCPPGHACMVATDPNPPGPGIPEAGIDLLKEVLTPLAAAIGGMLAGLFIKKGRKNGR